MKAMIVLDSLWVGGTERSIADLLPALADSGILPVIVCLRKRAEGVQEEVLRQGFKIHFLEEGVLESIQELRKIIRAERPDVIHSSLYKANLITRFAASRTGVPVLTSLVNTPYEPVRYHEPGLSRIRLKMTQHLDSLTSRFLTTHFHAVSQAAKDSAIRTLGISPDRITVVERGRDAQRMGTPSPHRKQMSRQKLGLSPDQFVLINVGRHDYQKGQEFLLHAFATVHKKFPSTILLIAGREGKLTIRLKDLAKALTISDSVQMLGHCNDVPEILASADLFVFPSLFEGLPGSVIEAMALGLPIVASDLDAIHEVVQPGQNALLVTPKDPTKLAAAIERMILSDSERKSFGDRSRQIFLDRFTLDRSLSRMIRLYENVSRRNFNG